MGQICPSEYCTGCMACYNSCNHQAIVITEDNCGFRFPVIDSEKCVKCGVCTAICPVNYPLNVRRPGNVYAVYSKDNDDRMSSASGGASSVFAHYMMSHEGVVYGCTGESCLNIKHIRISEEDELNKIKGSKYVQSNIGSVFTDVKKDLLSGNQVLFVGTPCQVAGLRSFLRRDYSSLITVDLVCHGVPSEKMLYDDIQKIVEKRKLHNYDLKVSFRCKKENEELKWGVFLTPSTNTTSGIIIGAEYPYDYYIAGFMCGLFYRECCYSCRYANPQRVSDITIGDYWGIGETFLDIGKGVSAVLLNTEKGICFFEQCKDSFEYEERELEEVIRGNGQLQYPSPKHKKHQLFRNLYPRLGFTRAVRRCLFSFYVRYYMIESVRNRLRRIPFIYRFYRSVKKFI